MARFAIIKPMRSARTRPSKESAALATAIPQYPAKNYGKPEAAAGLWTPAVEKSIAAVREQGIKLNREAYKGKVPAGVPGKLIHDEARSLLE